MAFRFTLDDFRFLTSTAYPEIRAYIQGQTEKYADPLRLQTALRLRFPDHTPAQLAAAAAQSALQARAARKCGMHPDALFTEATFEMASSAATASLHRMLLRRGMEGQPDSHGGVIVDCCAGIGSDAVRLAQLAPVLAIEADPLLARLCRHNLGLVNARGAVLAGNAEHWLPALRCDAVAALFADPARRDDGGRHVRGSLYSPPLPALLDALPGVPSLVKIAPAADADAPGWGRAFVAAGRECKEQLLHRDLGLPPVCVLRAEDASLWTPGEHAPVAVRQPAWIMEAHNAVVRSGAVAQYFREYGAEPIDPRIAYGLADERPPDGVLHQSFRILELLPFNRKRLREAVRAHGFGPGTEIKKRGFPDTPEQLRAGLALRGDRAGVILIARQGTGHVMVLASREESATQPAAGEE